MKKRKLLSELPTFPAYNKIVDILMEWNIQRHNAELCAFEIFSVIHQSSEEMTHEDAD